MNYLFIGALILVGIGMLTKRPFKLEITHKVEHKVDKELQQPDQIDTVSTLNEVVESIHDLMGVNHDRG